MTQLDPRGAAPSPDPQSLFDGTLAQSLNNDFIAGQQRLLFTDPDAFYRKRGPEALAATPEVLGKLKDLRDTLLDTTTTAQQRQILAQALDNHLSVTRGDIARHAERQSQVWRNATAQNRIDLLRKQAGFDYADPDSVTNYADAARSAALDQADVAGLPTDSEDARSLATNAASTIWRSAIETALDKGDTKRAIALHTHAGESIAPSDAALLGRYIAGAREHDTGRDYAARFAMPVDDRSSPLDVGRSLDAIDTAHAEATAQNQADWPDNPSQRATNQHFLDINFGQKKRDVVMAKADLDQRLANWLDQPTPDGQPQTDLPPPSLWSRLGDAARKDALTILARNAAGGSAAPPEAERADGAKLFGIRPAGPAAKASATALPFSEAPALPSFGAVAGSVARAAAPAAGAAAAGSLAFGATLLIPWNTQDVGFSLGDGLRVRLPPGQRTAIIERRVEKGFFGGDFGSKWEALPVEASVDADENYQRILSINQEQLKAAIGDQAANGILARPGVASGSQEPPPAAPTIMPILIGVSVDGGKTTTFHEATQEEVEDRCYNFSKYQAIALGASAAVAATGLPNGKKYGQLVHRKVEDEIKSDAIQATLEAQGIRELSPELALRKGIPRSYGKGSSRLDIIEIHDRNTVCIYEVKTGNATFPRKTYERYSFEGGEYARRAFELGYTHVYVIPIYVP